MISFDEIAETVFDVIVIGGGPAGSVMASRLSENGDKKILLVESGPDLTVPGSEDPGVISPFAPRGRSNPATIFQGTTASIQSGGLPLPYLQGHGLGGGSNINGMGVDRGLPADYDEWASLGADGWSWANVLPYFKKIENDLDYGTCDPLLHGSDGPMPVKRIAREDLPGFASAICSALERHGLPFLTDHTGQFTDGVSVVPNNTRDKKRISAPLAYLDRNVRARPNLTILPNTKALKLIMSGAQVIGVEVLNAGSSARLSCHKVVLTCGAIQTPTLLLHSGIGPADDLTALGIEVAANAPGVGRNLQNHPFVGLISYLPKGAAQRACDDRFLQAWARFSSGVEGSPDSDMHIILVNKADWHAVGRRIGTLVLSIFRPKSRGKVSLETSDITQPPRVDFDMLSAPCDLERLNDGLRIATGLLIDEDVKANRHQVFMPNGALIAKLARKTVYNAALTRFLVWLLDVSFIRRLALGKSEVDIHHLNRDADARDTFIKRGLQIQYHVAGTCKMGAATDEMAVVDSHGSVRGVEGVRVADASIFPVIPRGCTHFITLMAAEKIADNIKADWNRYA